MAIYTHQPLSGQAPESIVILLHGYGSNGEDLIGLAPYWEKDLPNTVFVAPDAPYTCEMGFGFQWFSLHSWAPIALVAGAEQSTGVLNKFIDEQMAKYNLPASKVALVGFSQGTMMSLYVGPRRTEKLGGIVGYSGGLLGGEALIGTANVTKPPVYLAHGEMDTVVPVGAFFHAKETLRQAGFDVSGHTTPGMAHTIDEQGIHEAGEFLKKVLA